MISAIPVMGFSRHAAIVPLAACLAALGLFAAPARAEFGVANFDVQASDASGGAYTQAGGHPFALTTAINFNTTTKVLPLGIKELWPEQPVKDITVDAPPGLVGNAAKLQTCQLTQLVYEQPPDEGPSCPAAAQVGVATVVIGELATFRLPVFNMVTPPGVPARFAFNVAGTVVTMDAHVRSASDYGVAIDVKDAGEGLTVLGTTLTLWGVPADPGHDPERSCPRQHSATEGGPSCATDAPRVAFLRMPTSCPGNPGSEGEPWRVQTDSWTDPGVFKQASIFSHVPPGLTDAPFPGLPSSEWGHQQGVDGCAEVPFEPQASVQPTSTVAASASGVNVSLSLPQSDDPGVTDQADLRKVVVSLPDGMTLNPSAADGLGSCSTAQIALQVEGPANCPESSKLGTVKITSPALSEPLQGAVYLAAQGENPFASLLAMYVVAEGQGVFLKLAGKVTADPATGQLTSVFDDQPQLPLSSLELSLKSGPRAPLLAPASCGAKSSSATLEGWNAKSMTLSTPYDLQCPVGLGAFTPSFLAGSVDPQAGAFSPLQLSFSRSDTEQQIKALQFKLAPGALAKLAGVPQCPDANAAAGSCPDASRIGGVTVLSGAGPTPVALHGSVYLTGPYNGGPFGEAVVVPAAVGPFNLGNVVVRGSIRIDPTTAQASVVSDAFPQFVGATGIPTDVRRVDVSLDRPRFTFNPTNCAPQAITGTAFSMSNQTAALQSPFNVANCANLVFKPRFTASTDHKASLTGRGASLDVKIAMTSAPSAPAGREEANIARTEVRLPKALPSRLSTLNLACREKQFAADPAGCPAGSRVGTAVVHTPILAAPLIGPAILVSHGGAAFPDLVLVLQGEGITLELTGHTQIKGGYTYSRFQSVPDAPVRSFELQLPGGGGSVLGANKPLCTANLAMPTTMVAQNGAVVHKTIKIAVRGCPKKKAKAGRNTGRGRRAGVRN